MAFLPPQDVIEGFEIVKNKAPRNFKKVLTYIERTYIGKYKENKKRQVKRKKPRFNIKCWNVRERILLDSPRTQNNQESWLGLIHRTISKGFPQNIEINSFDLLEYKY